MAPAKAVFTRETFQFFKDLGRHNRKDVSWVEAQGRGGQTIRIVRELELVVVVTAGYYQDFSPQAFKTLYSVFAAALKATSSPA